MTSTKRPRKKRYHLDGELAGAWLRFQAHINNSDERAVTLPDEIEKTLRLASMIAIYSQVGKYEEMVLLLNAISRMDIDKVYDEITSGKVIIDPENPVEVPVEI